jgi:hypothetical protein
MNQNEAEIANLQVEVEGGSFGWEEEWNERAICEEPYDGQSGILSDTV